MQQPKQAIEVKDVKGREDFLRRKQLSSISFHYGDEKLASPEAFEEEYQKLTALYAKKFGIHQNGVQTVGAYQHDRLIAAATFFPYTVRFDGHDCDMSGVGGVITDPEARRSGAIRAILTHQFERMRAQGQIFSMLQPFSTEFYRKFGYEASVRKVLWEIPIEFMPPASNAGFVRYEGTDAQKQDIKAVYASYAKELGLSLVRDDELHWREHFERWQPYKSGVFAYLHYNAAGQPDAFFAYTMKYNQPSDISLDACNSIFYADTDALRAVLAFVGTYHYHATHVKLYLPECADLSFLLPQLGRAMSEIKRSVCEGWMARVIDAEAVLRLARYRGEGRFTVRIEDGQCPHNCDTFAVRFGGGETQVTRGAQSADIACSIRAFTTLITGKMGFEDIGYLPEAAVHGNGETLSRAFYRKPLWIADYF